jgi:hypothetical protein
VKERSTYDGKAGNCHDQSENGRRRVVPPGRATAGHEELRQPSLDIDRHVVYRVRETTTHSEV